MNIKILFIVCMTIICDVAAARKNLSLDGKKVVFIGNSFIYYGGCVLDGRQRHLDEGFFSQLCKSNGEHTEVYDCTYGGHHLKDFTPKGCVSPKLHVKPHRHCPGVGTNLIADVPLDDIDIVFISEAGENNQQIIDDIKAVMRNFHNPKTRFCYLVHTYTYYRQHRAILDNLATMKSMGITIVPWGQVAYDLTKGNVKVKGSKQVYKPTTFIKNKGDNHHPNPLAGYVTALMAYCAVTGKNAVGQEYGFVNQLLPAEKFVSEHYKTPADTNYPQILESAKEMKGLQRIVERTLRNSAK